LLAEHAKVLNFVMADPQQCECYLDQVLALAKAYALCGARDEAAAIRDDVRLFTDVRAAILKIQHPDSGRGGSGAVEIDTAIAQLVNEAVAADQVLDIYHLAGVDTPELSLLSDEFLDTLAHKPQPNLQLAMLRKLIDDQIRTVARTNIVQSRKFSEQLQQAVNAYTNRSLSTAEIIAELVELAKQMKADQTRHEKLGLSVAEAALYDAIVQNDAAVLQMGDDTLKHIAIDLVYAVRTSVSIDWNLKESVRAKMRAKIKRLLAKYHYPPDLEAKAVELVLEQAELLADDPDAATQHTRATPRGSR
jgi:type I restriction enzyme R subunit